MITVKEIKTTVYETRDGIAHRTKEAAYQHESAVILRGWLEEDGADIQELDTLDVVRTLYKRGLDITSLLGVFVADAPPSE